MSGPLPTLTESLAHGIRPGLERIMALLAHLGQPQRTLRTVHVAGTNGKGSVVAMLASILGAAGYRVGRYTSPHLISYRERMRVDEACIPADRLAELLAAVDALTARLAPELGPVTEFERLTAVGLTWLAAEAPDLTLVEVGLGGRLDATNVLERPEVTVITRLALDHADYLGTDLAGIAREKAGIMRSGRPVVYLEQPVTGEVLRHEAAQVGAIAHAAPETRWEAGDRVTHGTRSYPLGLPGSYQAENAALVLETVERLRAAGWELPEAAVARGLATARWPGRLERWEHPGGQRYCFDGAHNLDGAQALARSLPAAERVVLAGVLADKQPERMLATLAELGAVVVLTRPPSPRGFDPALHALDGPVIVVPAVPAALARAQELAAGREILVVGSLYLVGAVCQLLGRDFTEGARS